MGWTTLSVREETLERFNDTKADANVGHVPEQSADLFVQALLDTWDGVDEGHYDSEIDTLAERLDAMMDKLEQIEGAQADTVGDALELADISNYDVLEQLDTVESAAREATEAAQSAERAVEELSEGRR